MIAGLLLFSLVCAVAASVSGAVAYALRDFSRPRVEEILTARNRPERLAPIIEHAADFSFLASSVRLVSILLILASLSQIFARTPFPGWAQQVLSVLSAAILATFFSIAMASSLARYFGESLIVRLDPYLHALRAGMWPLLFVSRFVDRAIFKLSPEARMDRVEQAGQTVEEDILAVVEEGEKEGVVDVSDRELIESAIQFRDRTAGQIMTPRPQIEALPIETTLDAALQLFQSSGRSRLPIYQGDLDHITGVLYSRDLLRMFAEGVQKKGFTLGKLLRPVIQFPESKPLKELLVEFRLRQVHIAIILDEFGGTAGLVTIEDILEELVGEIADEHEPLGLPAVRKVGDDAWELDATTRIEEVNSVIGLGLPEDGGFETLGGYVSSVLGHIPEKGEEFRTENARWQVLEAEPTKVIRVRVEVVTAASGEGAEEEETAAGAKLLDGPGPGSAPGAGAGRGAVVA